MFLVHMIEITLTSPALSTFKRCRLILYSKNLLRDTVHETGGR